MAMKQPSAHQHTLEMLAHIIYRDVTFTLNPGVALPWNFGQHLIKLGLNIGPCSTTPDFVQNLRNITAEMKSHYEAHALPFYSEHMSICFTVAGLVSRLENMQDCDRT